MKKTILCIALGCALSFFASLFALPSSDFSLYPAASKLRSYDGIFYTKTGALSLSWMASENVRMIQFSGSTLTGALVYKTGSSFATINSFFPSNTSLTGGVYWISGMSGSGDVLGSEKLVVDKIAPKATSIAYFDDNHNGKIDRLFIATDEIIVGTVPTPHKDYLTIETRTWWLLSSCSFCDLSENITSAISTGTGLELRFQEGDNIKPHLSISSPKSDLRFQDYTTSLLSDYASNSFVITTSKFPNGSLTGIIDGTNGIDYLDTGFLNGLYFSGALRVPKIDSRSVLWVLTLSGMQLTIDADSYIGDSNILKIGSGSRIVGNGNDLFLGAESRIQGSSGGILFSKSWFSSSFQTLSWLTLSDVSTLTESGIYYSYTGNLIGSWLELSVDYVTNTGSISLFSGALDKTTFLIPLSQSLASGNLRATIFQSFETTPSSEFSLVRIIFDELTRSDVAFSALIASTGSLSDITRTSARISWVVFRPDVSWVVKYGTGDLSHTGIIQSGSFLFSDLAPGSVYLYRLWFVPFASWEEILSPSFSFSTLPAAIAPPPITIAFQSPTYLVDQDPLLSEFTCDTTHEECRINFNLEPSFSSGFIASDYFCELDFDLDRENGEEYKCNPNTIVFPRWHDYTLRFRIINSSEVTLYSEKIIHIHAPDIASPTSTGATSSGITLPPSDASTGGIVSSGSTSSGVVLPPIANPTSTGSVISSGSTSSATTTSSGSLNESGTTLPTTSTGILIADPIITIQSGLDDNRVCKSINCSVNLEYIPKNSKEACSWSFWSGSYSSGTENKCNPGYIQYPVGIFSISLRVYEKGNESNYREKSLSFSNPQSQVVPSSSGGGGTVSAQENHRPHAEISLQGAMNKEKIQEWSVLTCFNTDTCSVNFTAENSYDSDGDTLHYFWNFWNSVTVNKKNPSVISYKIGEYDILLRVTDSKGFSEEKNFHVSVRGKWVKNIIPIVDINPLLSSIRISSVSPNPIGSDGISEWIELSNPLLEGVSLSGCTLSDDSWKKANMYTFPYPYTIAPNTKKRFYTIETGINLTNNSGSVIFACAGKTIDSISWSHKVPEWFVIYWGVSKITATIHHVFDDASLEISSPQGIQKMKLAGIDHFSSGSLAQEYNTILLKYMREQLEGKEVILEFDSFVPYWWDIPFWYIHISSANFNEDLIRLGYALPDFWSPFRYFSEFEKTVNLAQKNKNGVWATNKEFVKILKIQLEEGKLHLKQFLFQEDEKTLDDLIAIDDYSEALMQKIMSRLFYFDFLSPLKKTVNKASVEPTNTKIVSSDAKVEDIKIVLQWALSKNRIMKDSTFICQTKEICSINFSAGKKEKNLIYFWDFWNGETEYGVNPLAKKYPIGTYRVHLRVLHSETWAYKDEYFPIIVRKTPPSSHIKSADTKKTPPVKVEKPLLVREQGNIAPGSSLSISRSWVVASGVILVVTALSFGYFIIRRKELSV